MKQRHISQFNETYERRPAQGTQKPGDRLLFWGSLLLAAWSLYELATRMEAAWPPIKMFINMAVGEQIPIVSVMKYIDFSILLMPLYLTGCLVLGILCFALRKRPFAAAVLMPAAVAAAVAGYRIGGLFSFGLLNAARAIPLLLVLLGFAVNTVRLICGRYKSGNRDALTPGA
jgi:hypothetical protein